MNNRLSWNRRFRLLLITGCMALATNAGLSQTLPAAVGEALGGLTGALTGGAEPVTGGALPGFLPENTPLGNDNGGSGLDFVGAQQLAGMLGLAPGSQAADALMESALGGATVVPLVNSITTLSGLPLSGFDMLSAVTLPGLGGSLVALDISGTGSNAGLSGVAFLNEGSAPDSVIGIAVLSDQTTGNGELLGVSLIGDSADGNDSLVGITVGNGQLVSLSVLSSDDSTSESCEGAACGEETDDRLSLAADELPQCSDGDADSDGVCDDQDSCPDTPENQSVLPNGCHLDLDRPLILEGIRFEPASTRLHVESVAVLEQAAQVLRDHPEALVVVEGHTDASGNEAYNISLSRRRAAAVATFLSHRGVEESNLLAAGYGSASPLANVAPTAAEQRRVQLRVVEPDEFEQVRANEQQRQLQEQANASRARAAEIARAREARRAAEQKAESDARVQEVEEAYKDVLEFLQGSGVVAPE